MQLEYIYFVPFVLFFVINGTGLLDFKPFNCDLCLSFWSSLIIGVARLSVADGVFTFTISFLLIIIVLTLKTKANERI